MTRIQIVNKIAELEQWLKDNPDHANRVTVETDLRNLYTNLEYLDHD